MSAPTATKVSPSLAAIQAAAAADTPPARVKPGHAPQLVYGAGDGTGNRSLENLDRLPGLDDRIAVVDDQVARQAAKAALEKFETAMQLLEQARDIRYAAKAVEQMKALGLVIDAELESSAWFRPADKDIHLARDHAERHVREHFRGALVSEIWPDYSRALRARIEAFRAEAAAARDSDAAFRRQWPSAASNQALFTQIDHALAVLEWNAENPPSFDWHCSMRAMVEGLFSDPI